MRILLLYFLLALPLAACSLAPSAPPLPVPPPAYAFGPPVAGPDGWGVPAGLNLRHSAKAARTPSPYAVEPVPQGHLRRLRPTPSFARFQKDGTLAWVEHAEEATALDQPSSVTISPKTGWVYVALTGDAARHAPDAVTPRAPNGDGQILELVPPTRHGKTDAGAPTYDVSTFVLAGDPGREKSGALYLAHPGDGEWFSQPSRVAADAAGTLWVVAQDTAHGPARSALYALPTEGAWRGRPHRVLVAPPGVRLVSLQARGPNLILGLEDGSFRQLSPIYPLAFPH